MKDKTSTYVLDGATTLSNDNIIHNVLAPCELGVTWRRGVAFLSIISPMNDGMSYGNMFWSYAAVFEVTISDRK